MTTRTHPGVRTEAPIPDGDDRIEGLDPIRVLRDAEGGAALAHLVARLRAAGFDGAPRRPGSPPPETASRDPGVPVLGALARAEVVTRRAADAALGPGAVRSLRRCGALIVVGEEAALTARLLPMRSIYTVLPRHRADEDIIYFGADSAILFDQVWAARGHGDQAVDLGTGNGFTAAALATRYDHVVAADLSGRCVATAALVPLLNPHLRSRISAVQMDVAAALRPGTADLVTANAPWVPETVVDAVPQRRFAAGGPTGFELPRRFIDQAADLLAPGGRAFIACLDIRFSDGRRPLAQHQRRVAAQGFDVTVTESGLNDQTDLQPWAARQAPGAVAARHVVVQVHRRR